MGHEGRGLAAARRSETFGARGEVEITVKVGKCADGEDYVGELAAMPPFVHRGDVALYWATVGSATPPVPTPLNANCSLQGQINNALSHYNLAAISPNPLYTVAVNYMATQTAVYFLVCTNGFVLYASDDEGVGRVL